MKKIVVLILVIAAAAVLWKRVADAGGDDALADLRHRLDAAEKSYVQAGRAAGMAGVDTSADAGRAAEEVGRVEKALREMMRAATSEEERRRITELLERAVGIRKRMG